MFLIGSLKYKTFHKKVCGRCTGHYNYDIHGNVKTLLQDNRKLATTGTVMGVGGSSSVAIATERFKRLDYDYDLISGNMHSISYQNKQADEWHHAYEYDADNRLTDVYTTSLNMLETATGKIATPTMLGQAPLIWENDARYFYYAHGSMSRMELGDLYVQGIDYIYTLQGWIKGVNSNTLNTNNDPGADGTGMAATNENALFARDVYGYSLNYFAGDYSAIDPNKNLQANSFTASITGSDVEANRFDLFNGNIGSMVTTITDAANPTAPITPTTPFTRVVLPLGNAYKYDQLNRLLQAVSYNNLDMNSASGTYNQFGSSGTQMYYNSFEYDANGNIETQIRKDHNNAFIDNLTYQYAEGANGKIQNRLYHVNEDLTIPSNLYTDDMEDQGAFDPTLATINDNNNYGFDEIGNLVRDDKEGIEEIKWRVDGKISEIKMSVASGKPNMKFEYNAMGLRIAKHKYNQLFGHIESEYYVHDASGNILAVYTNKMEGSMASHKLVELDVYGTGKIGVVKPDKEMIATTVDNQNYTRTLGKKTYFLSNHIGNNLTSITDKKIPIESTITLGEVEYFIVEIESAVDYSAFGVELYDRKFSTSEMAYGFDGQRKDNEIYGEGNSYTAEFWQYDPRLGRRWNVDPLAFQFPNSSPFQCLDNNPISNIDILGLAASNPDDKSIDKNTKQDDGKDDGKIVTYSIGKKHAIQKTVTKYGWTGIKHVRFRLVDKVNPSAKLKFGFHTEEIERDKSKTFRVDNLTKGQYDNAFGATSRNFNYGKDDVDSDFTDRSGNDVDAFLTDPDLSNIKFGDIKIKLKKNDAGGTNTYTITNGKSTFTATKGNIYFKNVDLTTSITATAVQTSKRNRFDQCNGFKASFKIEYTKTKTVKRFGFYREE